MSDPIPMSIAKVGLKMNDSIPDRNRKNHNRNRKIAGCPPLGKIQQKLNILYIEKQTKEIIIALFLNY